MSAGLQSEPDNTKTPGPESSECEMNQDWGRDWEEPPLPPPHFKVWEIYNGSGHVSFTATVNRAPLEHNGELSLEIY